MSKKKTSLPANLVKHPRYGTVIRPSGTDIDAQTLRKSFWRYSHEKMIFPETAIPADLRKQNYSTYPCDWYVDVLKTCRDCGRPFLFYAVEQKHWYEVLRFKLDANCVRCPECRKTDQTLRRRFQRFSNAIQRADLSNEELATLAQDAVFLWDNGLLSRRDKLNRIRNQALRRIPDHPATQEIEYLTAELERRKARDRK